MLTRFLKSIRQKCLESFFKASPYRFFSLLGASRIAAKIKLRVKGCDEITLHPASYTELTRFQRLETKEPETISWISSFRSDCLFLDIGANVGVYSVYTLIVHKDARVIAFEPEPSNFLRLSDNLRRAGSDRSIAYPVGAAKQSRLGSLSINQGDFAGTSNNQLNSQSSGARVGCVALSIDDAIQLFGLPIPQYIKIDVDGIELEILAGMSACLARKEVLSVLVESQNAEMTKSFDELFESLGFSKTIIGSRGRGNRIYSRERVPALATS